MDKSKMAISAVLNQDPSMSEAASDLAFFAEVAGERERLAADERERQVPEQHDQSAQQQLEIAEKNHAEIVPDIRAPEQMADRFLQQVMSDDDLDGTDTAVAASSHATPTTVADPGSVANGIGTHPAFNINVNEILPYESEPTDPNDHSRCTHGPITEANGYEFFCQMPRGCNHQWQKGNKEARKCISNFFGRNKRCTSAIKNPVVWCRSHYQTNAYSNVHWKFQKLALIDEQLIRIENDSPGTYYTITVKHSEAVRLDAHMRGIPQPNRPPRMHNRGTSYEAPLNTLRHIELSWIGTDKSPDDCRELLHWVYGEMTAGRVDDIPSFEFLPHFNGVRVHVQDPQLRGIVRSDNRARARAQVVDSNMGSAVVGDVEMTGVDADMGDSEAPTEYAMMTDEHEAPTPNAEASEFDTEYTRTDDEHETAPPVASRVVVLSSPRQAIATTAQSNTMASNTNKTATSQYRAASVFTNPRFSSSPIKARSQTAEPSKVSRNIHQTAIGSSSFNKATRDEALSTHANKTVGAPDSSAGANVHASMGKSHIERAIAGFQLINSSTATQTVMALQLSLQLANSVEKETSDQSLKGKQTSSQPTRAQFETPVRPVQPGNSPGTNVAQTPGSSRSLPSLANMTPSSSGTESMTRRQILIAQYERMDGRNENGATDPRPAAARRTEIRGKKPYDRPPRPSM